MSEQRLPTSVVGPVDGTDPFDTYPEFIDIPDPAESLHAKFVQTMPYLYGDLRLRAAQTLAPELEGKTPNDFADSYLQDSPFIKRRMLELMYGEMELSDMDVVLQAVREASDNGEQDAAELSGIIEGLAHTDPDVTIDELYQAELQMFISSAIGVNYIPARLLEPEPAADYAPDYNRIVKATTRPPLVLGGTEIIRYDDIHKLTIPELIQPWEAPAEEVIAALERGSHVLLDSRRNSGKTHIFPGVLRGRAPANWQISEMTNNVLRGGEAFTGDISRASDLFRRIYRGDSVEQAIADEEQFFSATTPHTRQAVGEPERRILIVDEAQLAVLYEPYREAGVLNKIADYATATDTQLVLINAIGDRRTVAKAKAGIDEVFGEISRVNIETQFDRPEYPRKELLTILGHLGVDKEVARWWAGHGAARALRTMRGVYLMYAYLSDPMTYVGMRDTRLRTTEQLKPLLEHRRGGIRIIDELAKVVAGSGLQMVALADYFDIREPYYPQFGYEDDTVPEDIR